MTANATDPATNPSPEDLARRAAGSIDEYKLGRVGHYSYQAVCQTALLVGHGAPGTANLVVFDSDGDSEKRRGVKIGDPAEGQATFHLNRDCPWGR